MRCDSAVRPAGRRDFVGVRKKRRVGQGRRTVRSATCVSSEKGLQFFRGHAERSGGAVSEDGNDSRVFFQASGPLNSEHLRLRLLSARIEVGQLADFPLLSKDCSSVDAAEMESIEAELSVVGGKIVYGANAFAAESPARPPIQPAWSPLKAFGRFYKEPAK